MNIIELHDEIWQQLRARRAQLPHALLIYRPAGIGKFDLARAFAESLLCENAHASRQACGSCLACGWLAQGNHPDLRLLQPDALAENESEGEAAKRGRRRARRSRASRSPSIRCGRSMTSCMSVPTAMARAWCCSTRPKR
jgi:DNA polymerase III delta prime subunit